MAQVESDFVNWLAYGGARALGVVLQSFEVDRNLKSLGILGDWWAGYDKRRRKRAVDNIMRSFPELTAEEADDLARRSIRYLIQLFGVEALTMPRMVGPSTWTKYVRLGELSDAIRALTCGKPVILISGHCGNFELLGTTLASMGFPSVALARPLDFPRINDWLVEVRERRGMTILTKFGAMDQVPDDLAAGRRVCFIADQNAGDKGLFVPFFGRLASAYKSIGLLAMRFETPIICGQARRLDLNRFHYQIDVPDVIWPHEWRDQPDPLYYITARYSRAIEMMVRAAPEQYFWIHRRWKSRPRHERLGKPMPRVLKDKIRSLPWMTDQDFGRVLEMSERDTAALQSA